MPFRAPLPNNPVVTQLFGARPEVYKPYSLAGHNGTDFRARTPIPVYAPFNGTAIVKDDGTKDYGLHIRIRDPEFGRECVCAHLSHVNIKDGDVVLQGSPLGLTGNTGFSEAPHLHFGLRMLVVDQKKPMRNWQVKNYDNGYLGWIDPLPVLIQWIM